MQKVVAFFGVQKDDMLNNTEKDKKKLNKIADLLKVLPDDNDTGVAEFARLRKCETNKNRPLKVILQSSSMVESILRNVNKDAVRRMET